MNRNAEAALIASLGLLFSILLVGGFLLGFAAVVARQARRRGYSFWAWMLAGALSLNPLLILFVLVMLPDARKKRLRAVEMRILQHKLAALPVVELDRETVAVPTASIGDQATTAPFRLRSVGDEETRG